MKRPPIGKRITRGLSFVLDVAKEEARIRDRDDAWASRTERRQAYAALEFIQQLQRWYRASYKARYGKTF